MLSCSRVAYRAVPGWVYTLRPSRLRIREASSGGDFVNQPRSQWDPDSLAEQPYDAAQVRSVSRRRTRHGRPKSATTSMMRRCSQGSSPSSTVTLPMMVAQCYEP